MPKFRKRPVLTEAMQYTGDNRIEITEWVHRGLPDIANAIVRLGYGDSLILRHKEGERYSKSIHAGAAKRISASMLPRPGHITTASTMQNC